MEEEYDSEKGKSWATTLVNDLGPTPKMPVVPAAVPNLAVPG